MNKIPHLYSFAFAREHVLFSGGIGKNMFQFQLKSAFANFLTDHSNEILTLCDFEQGEEKKIISILTQSGQSIVPEFSLYIDHFMTYITFLAPSGEMPDAYLRSKIRIIELLFRVFEIGTTLFLETEAGKSYQEVVIGKQPLIVSFTTRNGTAFNLSIEVHDRLLGKLRNLLYRPDPSVVHAEVIAAIHSILPKKKMMQKRTYVMLKEDYVQIEIFGHHCALITDFSGGHRAEEKLVLSGKHIDTALQMLTLFAAAGTLFRLAENS